MILNYTFRTKIIKHLKYVGKMAYHLQNFNFCSKSLVDTFPIIISVIFQFFLKPMFKNKK